ncbi:CRISPR-associated endonuclease Cas1 [Aeropyrum pernix]|uniref:CRISPR-associated endonuclease Cas1 n=1 Tax=Aeropyrum pernix TaxID=56636 RepID=A0A401HBI7_AERPX|nr:CRISPR-associated endonuclease Cas1 [Aeropyrum pernix]GBF09750.1 CRISPR-associated endonuclease Cas1 [Aeropyrum pernix]
MARILHVDGYGVKLGVQRGNLVISENGGRRSVSPGDIDLVVIASSGVSVSSRALRLLARSGVELVVLDSNGDPVGLLYMSYYTRTPFTRKAQYEALLDGRGGEIAVEIAYSKVYNQACHVSGMTGVDTAFKRGVLEALDHALKRLESMRSWAREAGLEDVRREVMTVEAAAARQYWAAVASSLPEGVGFEGRDREGSDSFNRALNYGYGILYSLAWRSLVLAGLDPYAGFLHTDRSGRPVLSFDYVEMFRVHAVDKPLASEFRRGWLPSLDGSRIDPGDRRRIALLVTRALGRRVGGETLGEAVSRYAQRLARSLRRGSRFQGFRGCRGWR